jgi:hypothetical protein
MTKNPEDDLDKPPIVLTLEASEISEICQHRFMAEIQGVTQRAAEVKLPARFKADGFDLELVEPDGDLAIYRQSRNGRLVSCEVIRIRHLPAQRLPDGALARPTEKYPSPSGWGTYGWSCATMERATERLNALRGCLNSDTKDSSGDPR